MSAAVAVTRGAAARLAADVRDIMRKPLASDGIYYEHDDADILKGYAMVVGPKDTPYAGGFYLFSFQFPVDYPNAPPVVTYWTNDRHTRFNPNLYKGGKVCLSVLNTWKGEGWTGCMTLRAVLVTLQTVLNAQPLLNEPGVRPDHPDLAPYNEIIQYRNWEWAVHEMLREGGEACPDEFQRFKGDMERTFLACYDQHKELLEKLISPGEEHRHVETRVYGGMRCTLAYDQLLGRLAHLYEHLNDKTKLKVTT
jgi:ubiquitin-protein ligase